MGEEGEEAQARQVASPTAASCASLRSSRTCWLRLALDRASSPRRDGRASLVVGGSNGRRQERCADWRGSCRSWHLGPHLVLWASDQPMIDEDDVRNEVLPISSTGAIPSPNARSPSTSRCPTQARNRTSSSSGACGGASSTGRPSAGPVQRRRGLVQRRLRHSLPPPHLAEGPEGPHGRPPRRQEGPPVLS